MNEQEFEAEARRRVETFLLNAGYSAHGTVEHTRNFIFQVLDIEPETVPTDSEGAE